MGGAHHPKQQCARMPFSETLDAENVGPVLRE
jgi:hypothetical protein